MNIAGRPVLFYLFWKGHDIVIEEMTDTAANELQRNGHKWIDVGMRTREEAEAKRLLYLSKLKSHR